jgi:choline dehydrogenase-like flavoprotein
MATGSHADVLIIGAGAAGAAFAYSLAETRMNILCLEQGDWMDPAQYPTAGFDWEIRGMGDFALSPNTRKRREDYPVNDSESPIAASMFNAVGGSTILYAGHFPRLHPSDFRVRSLDGVADDWPIDYFELLPYFYRTDRQFGVSGLPGDPAYPPDTEDAPMPPLPIGSAGLKVARAQTKLGWHWWPEFNSINSVAYDGRRPCVQRSTCQSGCNEGAKASTDLTHYGADYGFEPAGPFLPLGHVTQRSGKIVHAWAFEGDCDPEALVSMETTVEWPVRSGQRIVVPEVDRVAFFSIDDARVAVNPAQAELFDRLIRLLNYGT